MATGKSKFVGLIIMDKDIVFKGKVYGGIVFKGRAFGCMVAWNKWEGHLLPLVPRSSKE